MGIYQWDVKMFGTMISQDLALQLNENKSLNKAFS